MSEKELIDNKHNFAQSVNTLIPSGYAEYSSNMKNVVKDILALLDRNNIPTPKPITKSWKSSGSGSAASKAYAMQGVLKYHGLADPDWRTAFMPSISVNNDAAYTIAHVNFSETIEHDNLHINGKPIYGNKLKRVVKILDFVRQLAGSNNRATVHSKNVVRGGGHGKGLGTSAAAGAALAKAAIAAL